MHDRLIELSTGIGDLDVVIVKPATWSIKNILLRMVFSMRITIGSAFGRKQARRFDDFHPFAVFETQTETIFR